MKPLNCYLGFCNYNPTSNTCLARPYRAQTWTSYKGDKAVQQVISEPLAKKVTGTKPSQKNKRESVSLDVTLACDGGQNLKAHKRKYVSKEGQGSFERASPVFTEAYSWLDKNDS